MPWWWDLPFIIHPCLEQHNSVSVCVHDVVLHVCIGDFFFFLDLPSSGIPLTHW